MARGQVIEHQLRATICDLFNDAFAHDVRELWNQPNPFPTAEVRSSSASCRLVSQGRSRISSAPAVLGRREHPLTTTQLTPTASSGRMGGMDDEQRPPSIWCKP